MNCPDVHQRLQPFLEDLLQESEYQAIHTHLAKCRTCHEHVAALGSMTYAVKELGEVSVPPDLSETTLFALRQPVKPAPSPAGARRPVVKTAALAAILVAAGAMSWSVFVKPHHRAAPEPPVVVTATVERPPVSEPEAAAAYAQLKAMAGAIGAPVPEASTAAGLPPPPSPPAPAAEPAHWHFTYTADPDRAQLFNACRILGIHWDYEADDLVVFTAARPQLQQLAAEIARITGQGPQVPAAATRISLYLDYRGPHASALSGLHWHLRFPSGDHSALFDAITESGAFIAYRIPELVVLSVPKVGLPVLLERVKALPGVVGELGSVGDVGQTAGGSVRVSIYTTTAGTV